MEENKGRDGWMDGRQAVQAVQAVVNSSSALRHDTRSSAETAPQSSILLITTIPHNNIYINPPHCTSEAKQTRLLVAILAAKTPLLSSKIGEILSSHSGIHRNP